MSEHNFKELVADNRIWWGKQGGSIPQTKRFLSEVKQGVTPQTFGHMRKWDNFVPRRTGKQQFCLKEKAARKRGFHFLWNVA